MQNIQLHCDHARLIEARRCETPQLRIVLHRSCDKIAYKRAVTLRREKEKMGNLRPRNDKNKTNDLVEQRRAVILAA